MEAAGDVHRAASQGQFATPFRIFLGARLETPSSELDTVISKAGLSTHAPFLHLSASNSVLQL
jgi:hypothetical protein